MMLSKKIVITLLSCSMISGLWATQSRVITMGRSDAFFMDDISIFRNPANIGIYPNMLIGDLGTYRFDERLDDYGELKTTEDDNNKIYSEPRRNRDPQRPFFGGLLSYSLNQSAEVGDQYPMISVGMVINRYDDLLKYVNPNDPENFVLKDKTVDSTIRSQNIFIAAPRGKVDLMMSYALENGAMLGIGAYFARQDSVGNGGNDTSRTELYKGNIGVNWPIGKTMDLEASVGLAYLRALTSFKDEFYSTQFQDVAADGDFSFMLDFRLFSALTMLNGDFVPHLGIDVLNFQGGEDQRFGLEAGVGINLNIDRGFFWSGVEGIYRTDDAANEIGGRIRFGIERNFLFDWLVWRIGGTKEYTYRAENANEGYWSENNEADGSDNDLIGFGFGVNMENRFKVDAVFAEDVFYTWTNLFSGNHHHLFTRFTATYNF